MSGAAFSAGDRAAMLRALELAAHGRGRTWPNPMVGCVVTRDGEVIAEGWHHEVGSDHAEADALRKVGFRAEGATLYVTLEPCRHWGRTPPCTDAILRAGVQRVVVGMVDPDERMRGGALDHLRDRGVRVDVGLLEARCRALNEVYVVRVTRGRPFVTLKTAVTLDGRTATRTGASRWITGEAARAHVHRERALSQAVGVGVGTVLADDPRLSVRHGRRKEDRDPVRVVFDSRLRTPPGAALLDGAAPVLICTTEAAAGSERAAALRARGATLLACGGGERVEIPRAMEALLGAGIADLLVEGGAELHGALVDAGCVDRVLAYVAPKVFGGRDAFPAVGGLGAAEPERGLQLTPFGVTRLGPDVLLEARPADGPAAEDWMARLGG